MTLLTVCLSHHIAQNLIEIKNNSKNKRFPVNFATDHFLVAGSSFHRVVNFSGPLCGHYLELKASLRD